MKHPSRLRQAAAVLLAAGLLGSLPYAAHADGDQPESSKLLLVLDSSGSMKEPAGAGGGTKIAAAKQALNAVVDKLPERSQVGLRVYGATVFSKQDKGACSDSQLVVPIGPADKPALKQAIAGYKPYGETPIAYSLRQAAADVGADGQRTIVLVSDGEETCDPDPCLVARQIAAKGIDLKIDVIGLRVGDKARDQLQCIADEGGGVYYDAENAGDLVTSLERTSLRAFRPFTIQGDPVKGALQPTADAPELKPGQYTDELGGYEEANRVKYYRIPYQQGETVHIAVTSRPSLGKEDRDAYELKLLTADGEQCAWSQDALSDLGAQNRVLNASLYYAPGNPECDAQDVLMLKVSRGLEGRRHAPRTGALPIELLVIQEPKLRDGQPLPEPAAQPEQKPVPQGKSSGEVIGGSSFNDAPTVAAGTWTDTMQTGEMLYYRTRVDWGQSLAVTFRMLPDEEAQHLLGYNGPALSLYAYAPDRSTVGMHTTPAEIRKQIRPSETTTLHQTLPEVRYRNREWPSHEGPIAPVSLGGYYYYAIQLGTWGKQAQVPVQISVQVNGRTASKPAYASDGGSEKPTRERETPQPTPTTTDTATEPVSARAVPVLLLTGSGVMVLAGLVLGVILLRSLRRGGQSQR